MPIKNTPYGKDDATYQALGGFAGIKQLVDDFYTLMDNNAQFATIANMHSETDALKRDKLTYFLCAWTGGSESYAARFSPKVSMPSAHAHLKIGVAERDMWLTCMGKALAKNDYPDDLQVYLLKALSQPAEVIRRISEQRHGKIS